MLIRGRLFAIVHLFILLSISFFFLISTKIEIKNASIHLMKGKSEREKAQKKMLIEIAVDNGKTMDKLWAEVKSQS